jgi:hypothetical protein
MRPRKSGGLVLFHALEPLNFTLLSVTFTSNETFGALTPKFSPSVLARGQFYCVTPD